MGDQQPPAISIHALREEGDLNILGDPDVISDFYPRPPRGGRHKAKEILYKYLGISIHALREEGDAAASARMMAAVISIHALREEGDGRSAVAPTKVTRISIHALREEGDAASISSMMGSKSFLSTPSARRATSTITLFSSEMEFLSTPSARRAT